MKNIYIIFVTISTIIFQSCSEKREDTKSSETKNDIIISKEQFKETGMQTAKIAPVKFTETLHANAHIVAGPDGNAYISSPVAGRIKSIFINQGDYVKKGKPLFSVESMEVVTIQEDFLSSLSKTAMLKKEFLRKKSLFNDKLISEKEFIAAESEYQSNSGILNGLKQKIKILKLDENKISKGEITNKIYLYAPINGFITEISCKLGQYTAGNENLTSVTNPTTYRLQLDIFEKDIFKLQKGMPVVFYSPDNKEKQFNASLSIIGKSVNNNSGTIMCYGKIDSKIKNDLPDNMFVNADILYKQTEKDALPSEAVITIDDKKYILRLVKKDSVNYYFNKKEIKTGISDENFTQILNPDTLNLFLTKGTYNLTVE